MSSLLALSSPSPSRTRPNLPHLSSTFKLLRFKILLLQRRAAFGFGLITWVLNPGLERRRREREEVMLLDKGAAVDLERGVRNSRRDLESERGSKVPKCRCTGEFLS
ncbi:unnamed protein product [Fraxinus pennsylvanica]|uniref:Uncharacterized protein n=1 Tax=Fraxinus pennsylvanica TaxID=56036 RepID=A0AAD2DLJ5_9LAMI|nr:unnamed protein product [Fraxinus pennsylvanica]